MDSRHDFETTWLAEMPMRVGDLDPFEQLKDNIKSRRSYSTVVQLASGLFKIESDQLIHYWYETTDGIQLAVELEVRPQALVVLLVGKDPALKGQPPYASDLYLAILDDRDRSVRLSSDQMLSDEGFAIWKRLFNDGARVGLYDRANPGQSFEQFDSLEQMTSYFKHHGTDMKNFQYVLSPTSPALGETMCFFGTRRYRELGGIL